MAQFDSQFKTTEEATYALLSAGAIRRKAQRRAIIPEALGNSEHVRPRGEVCDGCNNYFASKG
jgi:hypothetical protein